LIIGICLVIGAWLLVISENNIIMRKITNYQCGAVLLIVLIVILAISLLGTTLVALFFNVLTASRTELYRTQALYLAEAGIAKAVNLLKTQAGAPGQIVIGTELQLLVPRTELGEGYFEVYSDLPQATLVSYGTSHGVTRGIQVKYSAF